MGVSANLLINSRHGVREVIKVLKAIGVTGLEVQNETDHSFLRFQYRGEDRQLYVARSSEYGGVDGTILSLNQWGYATELLKRIGAVTGGFLQPSDCESAWESIQDPHRGNACFILEHQILNCELTREDADELADEVAKATGYERRRP